MKRRAKKRVRQIIVKVDLLAMQKQLDETRQMLARCRDQVDMQRRAIEYLAAGTPASKQDVANILQDRLIF